MPCVIVCIVCAVVAVVSVISDIRSARNIKESDNRLVSAIEKLREEIVGSE